jgi:hypothetical protein
MMEAAQSPALVMIKPDLLLQVEVVALDPPAELGRSLLRALPRQCAGYDRRELAEVRRDLAAWLSKWNSEYSRLCTWVEENIGLIGR